MMLVQLLNLRGYCAESVGSDVLAGEMTALVERKKVDIALPSWLPRQPSLMLDISRNCCTPALATCRW